MWSRVVFPAVLGQALALSTLPARSSPEDRWALSTTPGQKQLSRRGASAQSNGLSTAEAMELESMELESMQRFVGERGRCLNFLHIPKTAGTFIEGNRPVILKKRHADVKGWGMKGITEDECSIPVHDERWPWCQVPNSEYGRFTRRGSVLKANATCSPWHVPPSSDEKLKQYYDQCETFCVVRNPLQRLISQYRNYKPAAWVSENCNTDGFRTFVQQHMPKFKQNPYEQSCHWVSQTEYVYGIAGPTPGAPAYCQHVLRFENLDEEFHQLMLNFGINVTLRARQPHLPCKFDVPPELAQVIEEAYAMDFKVFGYKFQNGTDLRTK